jgi:hypothetical protein
MDIVVSMEALDEESLSVNELQKTHGIIPGFE